MQQQAAQKGKKEEAGHILLSPATNYPAAQWQQKAERRRRRRSAGPGGAAGVLGTKGFSVLERGVSRWQLRTRTALCSFGFGFSRQTPTWEGLPCSLGELLLPEAGRVVSCYCWSVFCWQADVSVVAELVPYWRLILGEREKSGQCGFH